MGIALILAEAVALLVLVGLILGRHYLGYIFSDDPGIIAMTALAILPMALYQPADALQVIYSNALPRNGGREAHGPLCLWGTPHHSASSLSTLRLWAWTGRRRHPAHCSLVCLPCEPTALGVPSQATL